jgi:hypothetical protein
MALHIVTENKRTDAANNTKICSSLITVIEDFVTSNIPFTPLHRADYTSMFSNQSNPPADCLLHNYQYLVTYR